jgi:hypothetical protein
MCSPEAAERGLFLGANPVDGGNKLHKRELMDPRKFCLLSETVRLQSPHGESSDP